MDGTMRSLWEALPMAGWGGIRREGTQGSYRGGPCPCYDDSQIYAVALHWCLQAVGWAQKDHGVAKPGGAGRRSPMVRLGLWEVVRGGKCV